MLDRVTRMTLAKLNSPNVKQGRIKCCHVPKPPAGSQRRLTAKSKINKRPDQKTGMEMPNKETTVARWARHELRPVAADTPMGTPTATAPPRLSTIRANVLGRREKISVMTGSLVRSDVPKSPRTKSPVYR